MHIFYRIGVMNMSNDQNSSVYNEKKIAAYESVFKETNFAKPMDIFLTITAAHLFGQAYIITQEGIKEGDPVYSRFVVPLEEITKIYINDAVKAHSLFIQCDNNIKGVVHRKRIVIPCLNNVEAVMKQIEEVRAAHMEKIEAAQQKEQEKKRKAIEEKQAAEPKKKTRSDDDLPDAPAKRGRKPKTEKPAPAVVPDVKEEAVKEQEALKKQASLQKPLPEAAEPASSKESSVKHREIKPLKPITGITAEQLEDLQSLEMTFDSDAAAKPVRRKKVILEPAADEDIPVSEPVPELIPEPVPEIIPETSAPAEQETEFTEIPQEEPVYEAAAEEPAYAVPEYEVPETVPEPASVVVPEPDNIAVIPASEQIIVSSTGEKVTLEDFQIAVRKLRYMRDNDLIDEDEYNEEKKKLLKLLY